MPARPHPTSCCSLWCRRLENIGQKLFVAPPPPRTTAFAYMTQREQLRCQVKLDFPCGQDGAYYLVKLRLRGTPGHSLGLEAPFCCGLACLLWCCCRWRSCCSCSSSWPLPSSDSSSHLASPANIFAASRKQIRCVTIDDGGLGRFFRIEAETGDNSSQDES